MLGVRRMGGVQVDLYQGDPETFVCDVLVRDAAALAVALRQADTAGQRHVSLAAPADAQPSVVLQVVKDELGARQGKGLGRVTVILGSLDHYYRFQDELFALFPDVE